MKSLEIILILLCFLPNKVSTSEKDVLNRIFDGYDLRIRPVKNANLPVVVHVNPQILRLIDVNTQQEYIRVLLSVDQTWKDEYLTWDPADYNGTNMTTVTSATIWLPDTTVASASFEPEMIIDKDRLTVRLLSDGTVTLTYPFVLSSYCEMKTDEYPYDQQKCEIRITSWMHQKNEIFYKSLSNGTIAARNNNSEWDILPITSEELDLIVAEGRFRQILYIMTIQRKPAYYVWVLIMPTLIVTALSIAGIFAPFNNIGDREEKVTLGLTTLLTLAVILSMVTGDLPRSTNLPLLGQFVLVEIAIIVICMALSVLILFLHQRATTRSWHVPSWLGSGFACFGRKQKWAMEVMDQLPPPQFVLDCHQKEQHTRFLHMVDELKLKSKVNIQDLEPSLKLLDNAVAKVNAYIENGNASIERKEEEKRARDEEEKREHQWLILFDSVDFLLFISFQTIHIVLYVTFFYHSY